ncbi:MAG: glycosyltransferase family 2 protein [Candidatus Omnitrophica bacterium]|nr:glycosyltransferase family 2 protein [Candidatus Omnitrophota bacterium]
MLSTYNGGRYLRELLDSVLCQSFTNWRLLVRDDGSQDETLKILDEYLHKHPDRISLLPNDAKRLGPSQSFGKLMELSRSPYVMFCDQDDVWLKEKISVTLDKMLELEKQYGPDLPMLVHTDSSLVDKDLNLIARSTHGFMRINPHLATHFRNLILHNVIIGNTVLLNKRLVQLSIPIPSDAIMHDWWAGIIAAALGRIGYVADPTILYRKHEHNTCGLRQRVGEYLFNMPKYLKKYYMLQERVVGQMKAFYERFGISLVPKEGLTDKEILLVSNLIQPDQALSRKRKVSLLKYYKDCPYPLRTILDLFVFYKIYK